MLDIKEGDNIIACYDLSRYDIKEGHSYVVKKIEKCDSRNDGNTCKKCPGKIQLTNTRSPDCWGYGQGFIWNIGKITNWRRRI